MQFGKSKWGKGENGQRKKRSRPLTPFEKQVQRLDSYFSEFIRLHYMNAKGMCVCYTCGAIKTWNQRKTHAGHFIGKAKYPINYRVRWDEVNVKPQCFTCNSNEQGQQFLFGQYLDRDYGRGTAKRLQIKATKSFNPDIFEMERTITYYREKVKRLKKTKLNQVNMKMEFAQ